MKSPLKVALLLATVLGSGCGGGGDADAPAAPVGSGTGPVAPAPDPNALSMNDCFKNGNNGAVYYMGLKYPSGAVIDGNRTELVSPPGSAPGTTLTTVFLTDGAGNFNKFSELQQRPVGNGLQTSVSRTFGAPGVVLENKDYVGDSPIGLSVGQSQEYTVTYTSQLTPAGLPPVMNQSTTRDTLVSIGPLQTAGRTFPVTCQIESIHLTFNGKPVNSRSVIWVAPKFGVVRLDTVSGGQASTLEVSRVVQEPS